jgi:hypothetical protein
MVGCYDCHNGPTDASIATGSMFAQGGDFMTGIGNFLGEMLAGVKAFLSEIGNKIFQA